MAASPPGWGPSSVPAWIGRLGAHVAGLFAGALAVASLLYAAGTRLPDPPQWTFAVLTAGLALVAAGIVPLELEGSRWRVPQSWSRLGSYGYPAAFGAALGTGLVTKLSSPGLYLLVAWAIFAPTWTDVWPVFAAFAAGRAIPFLVVAMISARRRTYSADQLAGVSRATRPLVAAEAFVLALVAAWAATAALAPDAPASVVDSVAALPRSSVQTGAGLGAVIVVADAASVAGLSFDPAVGAGRPVPGSSGGPGAGRPLRWWQQLPGAAAVGVTPTGDVLVATDDRLIRLTAEGEARARVALPPGYRWRAVLAGDDGRAYVVGRGPTVVEVEPGRGVVRTLAPARPGGHDREVYGAALLPGGRLLVSYHGRDTTGADLVDLATGGWVPCGSAPAAGDGCVSTVHGAVAAYGEGAVAATGLTGLLRLDGDGAVGREYDTGLYGNHLMEFAVVGDRAYALGPCGYTGGLSEVDLAGGAARVLSAPRSDGGICGERIARYDDGHAVVTDGRRVRLVRLADAAVVAEYEARQPVTALAVIPAR